MTDCSLISKVNRSLGKWKNDRPKVACLEKISYFEINAIIRKDESVSESSLRLRKRQVFAVGYDFGQTFFYTDLNIYFRSKDSILKGLDPEMEKNTETSQLYENFLFIMQDRKLK